LFPASAPNATASTLPLLPSNRLTEQVLAGAVLLDAAD